MVANQDVERVCAARELIRSLIDDKKCFSSEVGAMSFADACSSDSVYEDCYEPQPFQGKEVRAFTV